MAMGSYNSNANNNKKNYSPSIRSNYSMSNTEAKIEKTGLSISYWNSMMKISIPVLEQRGDRFEYNEDKGIAIYLTHTKARMLAYEIEQFLKDKNAYNNAGVNSSDGLISISNGKELGLTSPCLIIRKINPDNGQIVSSIAYEFKTNYHYAIRNFNEEDSSYDNAYYEDLELLQLKDNLEQYYISMTNAMAYSVIDCSKYDMSRLNTKLDSICENLGIEYKRGGKSSGSFFSNSNNSSSDSISTNSKFINSTISELEDEFE